MTGEPLDATLRRAEAFTHWTPVTLRFRDLDMLGHVNNVSLAGWLEDARVAMELPVQPLTSDYVGPVVVLVDLRIQFLAEIRPGSDVKVGTRIQRLGNTSVTIGQAVFADGVCSAVAEAVEVLIDEETRRSTRWPEAFQTLFATYLSPVQPQ